MRQKYSYIYISDGRVTKKKKSLIFEFKMFLSASPIACSSWKMSQLNRSSYRDGFLQGWEFAHRFSERIARFLPKNKQMSDSRQKTRDSLICSFLVSDLSDLLKIALISSERCERITHGCSFW